MSSFKHVFEAPGRLDERKPSISQKMSVLGLFGRSLFGSVYQTWRDLIWILRDWEFRSGVETLNNGWPTVER